MTAAPVTMSDADAARLHTGPSCAAELTRLERRVAVAASPAFGCDMTDPEVRHVLRDEMRRAAYHEAGHLAAKAFTLGGHLSVTEVTIIPSSYCMGHILAHGGSNQLTLAYCPSIVIWREGHRILLDNLAGRGVEARLSGADAGWIVDDNHEEAEHECDDLWWAVRLSWVMSRRGWHGLRVLERAGRWTQEMLRVPGVWDCVERTAELLLERGTIRDHRLIRRLVKDVPFAAELPQWRRRLFPTRSELRSAFSQTADTRGGPGIGVERVFAPDAMPQAAHAQWELESAIFGSA